MDAYRLMGIVNVTPDSFSDGGLTASRRPWRRPQSLVCTAHFAPCVLARNAYTTVRGWMVV
jgi:dihydropteroate synthase